MSTASVLRHVNVRNCLRLLRDKGQMSRAELARGLGTTRTTAGYAIAELEAAGLVTAAGSSGGAARGRPGVAVRLDPTGAYFFGVDLEADNYTIVLADFLLERRAVARSACDLATTAPEDLCRAIVRAAADLAPAPVLGKIFGLGVSVPGIITPSGNATLPGIGGWSDVKLQSILEDAAPGWAVRCCNDAVAFALGHADQLTALQKQDVFFVLLTPGGIGSVRMRHGGVDRGVQGVAGEIGLLHLQADPGGRWRTFQDVALSVLPRELLADPGTPDRPWQDWDEAIGRWAETVARGLLDAIYMIDPERIVIVGPLAPLFDRVRDRVERHLRDWLMPGLNPPKIDVVEPRSEAAVIGAAAMVREDLFTLPRIGEVAAEPG